jgi:hypothetical protein
MLNICSNVETLRHPNPLLQSFDVTERKKKGTKGQGSLKTLNPNQGYAYLNP